MRTFLIALLIFSATAAHADAMRCGTRLVTTGDLRAEVRGRCGEPTDIQTKTILRRPYYGVGGRHFYYGDGVVEIPVEIWTYNFGPTKLMRQIRFVDGVVEDIETLGYGFTKPRS